MLYSVVSSLLAVNRKTQHATFALTVSMRLPPFHVLHDGVEIPSIDISHRLLRIAQALAPDFQRANSVPLDVVAALLIDGRRIEPLPPLLESHRLPERRERAVEVLLDEALELGPLGV